MNMKSSYYNIPLDLTGLFLKDDEDRKSSHADHMELKKSHSLKSSVDNFIELLIITYLGEYKSDNEFGFEIWDIEFENMQIEKFNTHNYPRQHLEKSLNEKIKKYEPRLINSRVEILFIHKKTFKGKKIKYFVDITVTGILTNKNSDNYSRSFQFAMGPFYK